MMLAALIQIVFVLLIVGVLLWGLQNLPGIDGTIKSYIKVLVVVVVAIWALYILMGIFGTAAPVIRR